MGDSLAHIIARNTWGGFLGDGPERFIAGIVVSGIERIKGEVLIPAGLSNAGEMIPVYLAHNEALPIGAVTALTVVGDQVHFRAHLGQSFLAARDVWEAIKKKELTRVSISFEGAEEKPVDGIHHAWRATEISLVDIAADPDARITSCWQRASVAPYEITTFWKEN